MGPDGKTDYPGKGKRQVTGLDSMAELHDSQNCGRLKTAMIPAKVGTKKI
jgi:hypothetical protein